MNREYVLHTYVFKNGALWPLLHPGLAIRPLQMFEYKQSHICQAQSTLSQRCQFPGKVEISECMDLQAQDENRIRRFTPAKTKGTPVHRGH